MQVYVPALESAATYVHVPASGLKDSCTLSSAKLKGRQRATQISAGFLHQNIRGYGIRCAVYRLPNLSGFITIHHTHGYTGCPRRNVPDFGRVFLMLKYTDITQNTSKVERLRR